MNKKRGRISPAPLLCSLKSYPALTKHPDSSAGDWSASRCLAVASALGGTHTRIPSLVKAGLYSIKLRGLWLPSRVRLAIARDVYVNAPLTRVMNKKRGRISPAPLLRSFRNYTILTKQFDFSADDWAASSRLAGSIALGGTQPRILGVVRTVLSSTKLRGLWLSSRARFAIATGTA